MKGITPTGQHAYTSSEALAFAQRLMRGYLAAMPRVKREETLQMARERARAHPQSYLAQHFQLLYGVQL